MVCLKDRQQLVTWFRSRRPLFELAQSRLSIAHVTTNDPPTRLPRSDRFPSSANITASWTIILFKPMCHGTNKTSCSGRRPVYISALEAKSPNRHLQFVPIVIPPPYSACTNSSRAQRAQSQASSPPHPRNQRTEQLGLREVPMPTGLPPFSWPSMSRNKRRRRAMKQGNQRSREGRLLHLIL